MAVMEAVVLVGVVMAAAAAAAMVVDEAFQSMRLHNDTENAIRDRFEI